RRHVGRARVRRDRPPDRQAGRHRRRRCARAESLRPGGHARGGRRGRRVPGVAPGHVVLRGGARRQRRLIPAHLRLTTGGLLVGWADRRGSAAHFRDARAASAGVWPNPVVSARARVGDRLHHPRRPDAPHPAPEAPMHLTPSLHRIGNDLVPSYLVIDRGEITIIDTGLPGHYDELATELAAIGATFAD